MGTFIDLETDERNLEIVRLRNKGLTFTEIGKIFGVSRQTAHHIYWRDRYVYREENEFLWDLTPRVRKRLLEMGIHNEDDLFAHFPTGVINLPYIGPQTIRAINSKLKKGFVTLPYAKRRGKDKKRSIFYKAFDSEL